MTLSSFVSFILAFVWFSGMALSQVVQFRYLRDAGTVSSLRIATVISLVLTAVGLLSIGFSVVSAVDIVMQMSSAGIRYSTTDFFGQGLSFLLSLSTVIFALLQQILLLRVAQDSAALRRIKNWNLVLGIFFVLGALRNVIPLFSYLTLLTVHHLSVLPSVLWPLITSSLYTLCYASLAVFAFVNFSKMRRFLFLNIPKAEPQSGESPEGR